MTKEDRSMRFSRRIQQMDTSVLRELLALTAKPDIISLSLIHI